MTKQHYRIREDSCERVGERIGLYLHNRLLYKENLSFEKHLETCNNCKLDVILSEKLKGIRDKEISEPAPDIAGKVMLMINS